MKTNTLQFLYIMTVPYCKNVYFVHCWKCIGEKAIEKVLDGSRCKYDSVCKKEPKMFIKHCNMGLKFQHFEKKNSKVKVIKLLKSSNLYGNRIFFMEKVFF